MRLAPVVALVALSLSTPARADLALRHTRLLDVTLQAADATAAAPAAASPAVPAEPRPVRRGVGWALVPFGIGQFANDQPVKGALVCISEILMFATAGTALGIVESSKTESNGILAGGKVNDAKLGETLQITYLVAFWAGIAVVGIGIADALIYRPDETTTVSVMPSAVAVKF